MAEIVTRCFGWRTGCGCLARFHPVLSAAFQSPHEVDFRFVVPPCLSGRPQSPIDGLVFGGRRSG